jgi:hypothetical protein
MDLGVRLGDVLLMTASWLFGLWPFVVLAPLSARRSSLRGRVLSMLAAWILAAAAGLAVLLTNTPPLRIIREPLNSLLFVAAGLVIVAFFLMAKRASQATH